MKTKEQLLDQASIELCAAKEKKATRCEECCGVGEIDNGVPCEPAFTCRKCGGSGSIHHALLPREIVTIVVEAMMLEIEAAEKEKKKMQWLADQEIANNQKYIDRAVKAEERIKKLEIHNANLSISLDRYEKYRETIDELGKLSSEILEATKDGA